MIKTTLWLLVPAPAAAEDEPLTVLGVAMVDRLPLIVDDVFWIGLVTRAVVAGATEEAVELRVRMVATVGTALIEAMAEVGGGDCGPPALLTCARASGARERITAVNGKYIFALCLWGLLRPRVSVSRHK